MQQAKDLKMAAGDTDLFYSTAALYEIPREELHAILAEDNLDSLEYYILQVEEGIFDGPFTADKIKQNLQLTVFAEELKAIQNTNIDMLHNNPYRDAVASVFHSLGMPDLARKIEVGQQAMPDGVSVSEKKHFYQDVFDGMIKTIAAIIDYLKIMQHKTPKNSRIISLFERCKKCENEIYKISNLCALSHARAI